ncbi:MAG TPA: hypothetical protein VEB21_08565 [Terriglobales bacterium]|nr:hypothetical protein [Terriglobales bacterium]
MQSTTRGRAGLTRRSFFQYTAVLTGWAALAKLRPMAAAAATSAAPEIYELRVLDAGQAAILNAIGDRMTFTGDPAMPLFHQTAALQTIDQTLVITDEAVREQLGWLLTLFEWGPPVFDFRLARFSSLDAESQDDYIRGWALSRIGVRRIGFQALKNLTMLGYYSQDQTWPGIHYRGPWSPRPRRPIVQA